MSLDAFDLRYIALTGCSHEDAADFRQMPAEGKIAVLEGRRAEFLSDGKADVWGEFVAFLGVLATVGGDIVGLGAVVTWAKGL